MTSNVCARRPPLRYTPSTHRGMSPSAGEQSYAMLKILARDKEAGSGMHSARNIRTKTLEPNRQPSARLNSSGLITGLSKTELDEYKFLGQLGQGAYASVKLAVHKPSNQKVAVKVYEKAKLLDPRRKKSVQREIAILKQMEHTNCIGLIDVIDGTRQLNLITEYVGGGSLFSWLRKKPTRRVEEATAKPIFKQIVEAISYCHAKSISHRDIKLENVLMTREGVIKLIDFGFSTAGQSAFKMFCGTPSYMSPEIVQRKEFYGPPADMWALGVMLHAMLTGSFPFKGSNDRELYFKIGKGISSAPSGISPPAKRLILSLLQLNPKKRPLASQVLTDPWFSIHKNPEPQVAQAGRPPTAKPLSRATSSLSTARTRPQTTTLSTSRESPAPTSRPITPLNPSVLRSIANLGYTEAEITTAVARNDSHLSILYSKLSKDHKA